MNHQPQQQMNLVPALIGASVSWWVMTNAGPMRLGHELNFVWIIATLFFLLFAGRFLSTAFHRIAGVLDVIRVRNPQGKHGSAAWIKNLAELGDDLIKSGMGSYWGTFKGQEVISEYESVALTIGPPGSGKSVSVVLPMVLAILHSKLIPDLKGSLSAVLANVLRERGEIVYIVNLGNVFANVLGETARYNPLCIINDCFKIAGGLRDISDKCGELTLQLLGEDQNGSQDNRYFRDGARDLIEFAIQICCLVYGDNATLGHVLQMLSDRSDSLLRHALWAAGRLQIEDEAGNTLFAEMPIEDAPWVDRHNIQDILDYKEYLKGVGARVADLLQATDSRAIDAFLTGAQQALKRFNITTRTHGITSETTFRFSELKERTTTIFITADAARLKSQKDAHALLQWCALQELKDHPRKHDAPVTYLADEATNYFINDLSSLLTFSRGYGVRVHLIIQFISEFRRVYSEDALKTLLGVAEITQFLPGQSEEEILQLIQMRIGKQSVMTESNQSGGLFEGVQGTSFMETERPLLTLDEIARLKQTILFIRHNKPLLVDLPPIAAISPFRTQIDPDPFHGGKPFLRPVQLRLEKRLAQQKTLQKRNGGAS